VRPKTKSKIGQNEQIEGRGAKTSNVQVKKKLNASKHLSHRN